MPLSLRARRLALYGAEETNAEGFASLVYRRVPSATDDRCWWGSVAAPTGRERTAGGQAEASIDAVIGLHRTVPVPPSALVLDGDTAYKITAVLPRLHGADEQQLLGVFADTATFTLDEG